MKNIILVLTLFSLTNLFAQDVDSYIELLKSDLKANKKAIITEVMNFDEQQSEAFWPIYRDYEYELDKLSDKRIANIKDFAANFDSLTTEKARLLIENAFDFQSDRLDLNKKYYKKFAEVLNPVVAAKYMQLENEIQLLIDLSINSNLPLAKMPGEE
ncbi:MAG: hypothetical protein U5J96_08065 [Ignavibacteriaceae bacterium]|nr:hypothetical protein [Ignavibacteriaceae bacterium]